MTVSPFLSRRMCMMGARTWHLVVLAADPSGVAVGRAAWILPTTLWYL